MAKTKKPKSFGRMGKSQTKAMNFKGYGSELVFNKDVPLTGVKASAAFNWYNNTQDDDAAKEYLVEFLEEMERYDLRDRLLSIEPKYVFGFASIAAWIARLVVLGYTFDNHKKRIAYLYERLDDLFDSVKRLKDENRSSKAVIGRSDYHLYSDKVVKVLLAIDDAIDIHHIGTYDYDFNAYRACENEKLHDYSARKMADLLEAEYENAFGPYDEDDVVVQEPEEKRKLLRQVVQDLVDYAADNYRDRSKPVSKKIDPKTGEPVARKPRKKKPVSIEKKLSRLQYLKEYDDYDIVSVNPEKIFGAEELWVFNVRYDMLQVYRSIDDKGLDLKGTTILNYDPDVSLGKRTGRYSVKYIELVKGTSKAGLKNVMKDIKSVDIALNGRINEHCVLLRVVT